MNIFVLDANPKLCAQYHNDKHCSKMILESVQMLSTALRLSGIERGYKITHAQHPCTKWVRQSLSNWLWLAELTYELNKEWRYRFNHIYDHKSFTVLIDELTTPLIDDIGLTPFAQAMPDHLRSSSAITSYRNYYKEEKRHIAKWSKRTPPAWWK